MQAPPHCPMHLLLLLLLLLLLHLHLLLLLLHLACVAPLSPVLDRRRKG